MHSSHKIAVVVRMLFALLVVAIALALLFKATSPVGAGWALNSIERSPESQSQGAEKSLDIERYPNEPLELVDLQIRQNSVKNGIRFKSKESISQWGLDNVRFKEKEDWFKSVKVRMKNISGRPIYGVIANLYLKEPSLRMLFRISLKEISNRDLKKHPLQPGDEIDLQVNEGSLNDAMTTMVQYGVDPSQAPVSLSIDSAIFSDDLQWERGKLMRQDPNNPKKWDAVDKPAPPEASRLKQPAGFTVVTFKPAAYTVQDVTRCQAEKGGRDGTECSGDSSGCYQWTDWGKGPAGNLSDFAVPGKCRDFYDDDSPSCVKNTIHRRLSIDPSCGSPSPTPTLTCLPPGYVYHGDVPCCYGPQPRCRRDLSDRNAHSNS